MPADRIPFVRPVFRGERFEHHAVPIEVLPELVTYRELVVEVARHLLLSRTPGRKRVPKGFFESFQIVLTSIEEGSAIPLVERIPPRRQGMPPLFMQRDVFDDARDLVEDVIARAGKREPLPAEFPLNLLPRFNHLGRLLKKDESIEFQTPGRESGAHFDPAVRRWLVLQKETSYEDDVDVVGTLVGGRLDQGGMLKGGRPYQGVIYVRLGDEQTIEVPQPQSAVQSLLTSSTGKRVHVAGQGSFNREDRLERFLEIPEVSVMDEEEGEVGDDTAVNVSVQPPLQVVGEEKGEAGDDPPNERSSSIDTQIKDLRALSRGWYEPDTPPLNAQALERLQRYLHEVLDEGGLPRPYLYPTPDAGVSAEWSFQGWEISATFDLDKGTVELHATHLDRAASVEESLEDSFSIDREDAVDKLRRFLSMSARGETA